MSNNDPFRSSAPSEPMAPMGQGMQYGRLVGFAFESPNWMMNVLYSTVCVLLGGLVVGHLVLYGYQAQILMRSITDPRATYPDFDTNKIGEYLIRGLWLWLGILITSFLVGAIAIGIILVFFLIGGLIVAAASAGGEEPGAVVAIIVGLGYFAMLAFVSVFSIFCFAPVFIKIALSGNLSEMFDFQWHMDFIRRTFGSLLLGSIVLMLVSFLFSFAGMLLCFVGMFPAIACVMLSQAQLFSQLYRVYLERGGQPVNIQELSPNF